MLNRRHIRIKVMQALYAYFHTRKGDLSKGEKELRTGLDKTYHLYLYLLAILAELRNFVDNQLEQRRHKKLPTDQDLHPNNRFIENTILNILSDHKKLASLMSENRVNWTGQQEMIGKLFIEITETESYQKYMAQSTTDFDEDKEFVTSLFRVTIANYEPLHFFFEENSIYWTDDLDIVCSMVLKTVKGFNQGSVEPTLMNLYKNAEEEESFAIDLFRKTILTDEETTKLIQEKTKNWEVDRIAVMDILLMKMAIAESIAFESIPTKVTLNEYIEISKFYSTPKSNTFINGILDKIIIDLKESGKIKKVGRGLIEN